MRRIKSRLLEQARIDARRIDPTHVSRYVAEIPTVSDYLEETLSQLGFSPNDYLDSHLYDAVAPETGTQAG